MKAMMHKNALAENMIKKNADSVMMELYKKYGPLKIVFSNLPKNPAIKNNEFDYIENDKEVFFGQVGYDEGAKIKEGRGILITHSKSLFEGFFSDDRKDGYGRLIQSDGVVYQGYFENDLMHGKGNFHSSESMIKNLFTDCINSYFTISLRKI